jgi:hypothetical protein
LLAGLDTLGDRAHAQGAGEADHRLHYGSVLGVLSKTVYERFVNLPHVYRKNV